MVECWCDVCDTKRREKKPEVGQFQHRMMILCPNCGNKRCPRASFHENACTGSNEDGQNGSYYGPKELWPNTMFGLS